MAQISQEAGQDMKALLDSLSTDQIVEMFENTIQENGYETISLQRRAVQNPDGSFRHGYVIVFGNVIGK